MVQPQLSLHVLAGIPLVEPGDNLIDLLVQSLELTGLSLQPGDVLVIAQKIISKSENRYAYLDEVEPSSEAVMLAIECDKDPRQMELVLRESRCVLRRRQGVVIVEHRNGYVHANAGIDKSNIQSDEQRPRVLLLPEQPDNSAKRLREGLQTRTGIAPHIIINDSAGRAWRNGTLGFALGTAGFEAVENRIGEPDLFGRELEITEVAVADELAAAASFLMGQAAEAAPVVLIRGAHLRASEQGSESLIRDPAKDMFR
ncbi:coenzyme F420-0:L-glutamate ligase [Spongiibacter sp. KMU-158]|uniref:Coenzyme F420-0:L-glutamate ligase n=1 Tax=Spongiibacter pelagi TaxID=2760804 RepID=A0A927GVV8_9GAMM|nr:coenzyme F420-0:L-glutamate ligase [Spongiibacter pelagi]MBD2858302.1 coenzyme F420-0:L-glutamate ligase [Spongiibacter pelagi]